MLLGVEEVSSVSEFLRFFDVFDRLFDERKESIEEIGRTTKRTMLLWKLGEVSRDVTEDEPEKEFGNGNRRLRPEVKDRDFSLGFVLKPFVERDF